MYRQGDLAYIAIDKLPEKLNAGFEEGTIFSGGTGGHNHDFKGGMFYPVNEDNVIGYLDAKDTVLLHPEHGEGEGVAKTGSLNNGIYKVVRQVEQTHEGMVPVVD